MKNMEKKKNLECVLKAPIPIFLDEDKPDQRSGCNILDVSFAEPITVGEIHFRNYYTAFLSISCKRVPSDKDVRNRDLLPWQVSVSHYTLMVDPHCEQGSQDIVAISPTSSLLPWSGIVAVRFFLKQPSLYWRKFTIEDLVFHKEIREQKQSNYIPRMFAHGKGDASSVLQEIQAKDNVSVHLQSMKHITESMKAAYTVSTVGRFEIDGNYDVNHLV